MPDSTHGRRVDAAYNEIRRRIKVGELCAGARVRQEGLSADLGVSRTPVREAISRLIADGLLVSQPNCGAHVRTFGDDEIIGLWRVREAFEVEAVRFAAKNAAPEDIADLRALCRKMDAATADRDIDKLFETSNLDAEFHRRLVELAGIQMLYEAYVSQHLVQMTMFRPKTYEREGYPHDEPLGGQHKPIVDALAAGDPQKAERAIRNTVERTINAYRERVARQGAGTV